MSLIATTPAPKTASLDALYALIRDDLAAVDTYILSCVKNEVALIGEIANHIIASGGKRIRPALTLISAQLCGYAGERHIALAAAIEFIHTATLLHDDVVDESKLRRGLATANEVFGNKASVLVGDFLLALAFQLMVKTGSFKVMKILSDASAVIAQGEVMQLMTEGEPETSVDDYLKVISAKTAVLFAAACELGAVVSEQEASEVPLRDFGMNIGIAFQLMDDVLDYSAEQSALGKTIGDDFREGKITLPVILAYNSGNAEEKSFWNRCMGELNQQEGDLKRAQALFMKYDTITKSTELAADYCDRARRALDQFSSCTAKSAMLDIVDFCASRGY